MNSILRNKSIFTNLNLRNKDSDIGCILITSNLKSFHSFNRKDSNIFSNNMIFYSYFNKKHFSGMLFKHLNKYKLRNDTNNNYKLYKITNKTFFGGGRGGGNQKDYYSK